jgi:membrane protein implicated in regulation of membrane protease activity
MFSLGFALIAIVFLTIWGFKTKYPIAFIMAFGVSLISAFAWYDVFDTNEALTVSIALIFYSFSMAGAGLFSIYKEGDAE